MLGAMFVKPQITLTVMPDCVLPEIPLLTILKIEVASFLKGD